MNCDQAFDVMTSPERSDSRALSHHLDACRRCRQMYETLEPALGLFAAVEKDRAERLREGSIPGPSAPVELARLMASRWSQARVSPVSERPRRRLWGGLVAASVAGLLLSMGLGALSPDSATEPHDSASGCTWLDRDSVRRGGSADAVVVSCARCHLSRASESVQPEANMREVSRVYEELIRASQAAADWAGATHDVWIAFAPRRGAAHV